MTARTTRIRRTLCIFTIAAGGWAISRGAAPRTPETRTADDAAAPACPAQPTTRPGKVLRGLESLTRIRMSIGQLPWTHGRRVDANTAKRVRTQAIERLRKELPHVSPEGTDDDWTLEFVFNVMYVPDTLRMTMVGKVPMVPALACGCRLSRAVVVDGRAATAVAYESVGGFGEAEARPLGGDDPTDRIRKAIDVFVKDWRKANPAKKEL